MSLLSPDTTQAYIINTGNQYIIDNSGCLYPPNGQVNGNDINPQPPFITPYKTVPILPSYKQIYTSTTVDGAFIYPFTFQSKNDISFNNPHDLTTEYDVSCNYIPIVDYTKYGRCDTCNGTTLQSYGIQYATQQKIWNTVRTPSSIFTMNLAALNAFSPPLTSYGNVNWSQMSDRPQPSVQKAYIPTGSGAPSSKRTVTRDRPGAMSPGGIGVDIKHNSYDRYLNRLKGKSPLRREPIPQQLTMFWATGFATAGPVNLTVAGGSLYLLNLNGGQISQISLADGSVTNINWLVASFPLFSIIAYGNYLYECSNVGNIIFQISLLDPNNINVVASGLNSPTAMTISGTNLYVLNINGDINQIDLNTFTVTTLADPAPVYSFGILAVGSYLYVTTGFISDPGSGYITQISIDTGMITNSAWATGFSGPFGLATYGPYLYVANSTGFISQVNLSDGSIANMNWVTGLDMPLGLTTCGSFLYSANYSSGTVSKMILSGISTPTVTVYGNKTLKTGLIYQCVQ